jgi:hypothetical protein
VIEASLLAAKYISIFCSISPITLDLSSGSDIISLNSSAVVIPNVDAADVNAYLRYDGQCHASTARFCGPDCAVATMSSTLHKNIAISNFNVSPSVAFLTSNHCRLENQGYLEKLLCSNIEYNSSILKLLNSLCSKFDKPLAAMFLLREAKNQPNTNELSAHHEARLNQNAAKANANCGAILAHVLNVLNVLVSTIADSTFQGSNQFHLFCLSCCIAVGLSFILSLSLSNKYLIVLPLVVHFLIQNSIHKSTCSVFQSSVL